MKMETMNHDHEMVILLVAHCTFIQTFITSTQAAAHFFFVVLSDKICKLFVELPAKVKSRIQQRKQIYLATTES